MQRKSHLSRRNSSTHRNVKDEGRLPEGKELIGLSSMFLDGAPKIDGKGEEQGGSTKRCQQKKWGQGWIGQHRRRLYEKAPLPSGGPASSFKRLDQELIQRAMALQVGSAVNERFAKACIVHMYVRPPKKFRRILLFTSRVNNAPCLGSLNRK